MPFLSAQRGVVPDPCLLRRLFEHLHVDPAQSVGEVVVFGSDHGMGLFVGVHAQFLQPLQEILPLMVVKYRFPPLNKVSSPCWA